MTLGDKDWRCIMFNRALKVMTLGGKVWRCIPCAIHGVSLIDMRGCGDQECGAIRGVSLIDIGLRLLRAEAYCVEVELPRRDDQGCGVVD